MDLPKLPPDAIVRPRLDDWLDRNAARPVRIVAGQPGCGKTVAVAAWARTRSEAVHWLTVTPGACAADVRANMPALTRGEIVIDGADRASAEARALLAELPLHAPATVRFVFVVRSARMFDTSALPTATAVLDAAALRFDEQDVARFCAALDVVCSAKERQRLLTATGGWAFAVAGSVRYAAAIGGGTATAYPRWLATARPLIAQLADEAAADDPLAAQAFERITRGTAGTDEHVDAAEAGFFVDRAGEAYCVNPVVASLRGDGKASTRRAPAVLHMFGRFRVTIGNGEVCFERRRARSLIQFLAVRGDGSATREELMRAFWPGVDRRAAAGALVDTCSTIRRAVAQRVGRDAVDQYFVVSRNTVSLQLGNVVSTAHRFSTHIDVASAAYERGDLDAAVAHWSAALRLHSAPLLSGEPPAPWIADAQRAFDEAARNAVHLRATVPSTVSTPGSALSLQGSTLSIQAVRALTA